MINTLTKRIPYRNPKILAAAKNYSCLAKFPGCPQTFDDVAFRHFNKGWAGKGVGQKADDFAGFFGCQHCEDLYSGLMMDSVWWELFKKDEFYYLLRANYDTLRVLFEDGVIK